METFQKNIITIGLVVLIIATILLLLIVRTSLENASWPPIKPECPDYWDISINSVNGLSCINNAGINECKRNFPNNVDSNQPGWCTSETGFTENKIKVTLGGLSRKKDIDCAKNLWAKYEGVTWDGITNNNRICEDTIFK